ncbi:Protein containing Ricin B, lectin domain [Orpheovirus IHUMI-LCC2]|uniref:Protein containing Ricin B, lectin domain n=1 Tax=Orpheovirus IHUMI-LCC2 TaxID=2023057 RepID=A0A2I2L6B0_9VIRU|nr:Protein containing Ricin B, lectin domain [Orpheovirus IHUMI-LCC2]SNW63051.1 Protein containing Ricin B, lectin domain [Orpheovirus IHUMI-LCC2]
MRPTLISLTLSAFVGITIACSSGTYSWLGGCCDPSGVTNPVCPPGVPTGSINLWSNRSKCLEALTNNTVVLSTCNNQNVRQNWTMEYVSNRLRLRLDGTSLCLTRASTSVPDLSQLVTTCDYSTSGDVLQWVEYYGAALSSVDQTWCLGADGNNVVQKVCGDDVLWNDDGRWWVNVLFV